MKKMIFLIGVISISGCAAMFEYDLSPYKNDESKPIVISGYEQSGYPNSAGGVEIGIGAYNNTNREIKYFDFSVTHYDRVNEKLYGKISKKEEVVYRSIGPFKYGAFMGGKWGPNFYNFASYCIQLNSVKITYMDSSELNLSGEMLENTYVLKDQDKCRRYPKVD
jgi:hypothetical protein